MKKTAATALPVCVAAVACLGLFFQTRSLSTTTRRNAAMTSALAAFHSSASGAADLSAPVARAGPFQPVHDGQPDWNRLARRYMDMVNGGNGDQALLALQRLMQGMSTEQLATAIREIEQLDSPPRDHRLLQFFIAGVLGARDPRMLVQQFVDLASAPPPNSIRLPYSQALQNWAEADPAAFQTWLDQQAAAGAFQRRSLDGKNSLQTDCESKMLRGLLASGDSATAMARLQQLTPAQREPVLYVLSQLKPGSEAAATQTIRSLLPEEEQAQPLASIAGNLVGKKGLAAVSAYMDQIAASPAERNAIAGRAAAIALNGDFDQIAPKLDQVYAWAAAASPTTVDATTGHAIGNLTNDGHFAEAAELAVRYHDQTGDDQIISSFFDGTVAARDVGENPDAALALIAKISDPAERERLRTALKLPAAP